MAAQKPLNIGLIGYGFMGRTHSNAYKRLTDFFPVRHIVDNINARNIGRNRYASFAAAMRGKRVQRASPHGRDRNS